MRKIQVTDTYLKNILQVLEDSKGYFDCYGIKNDLQKHIRATKQQLDKDTESIVTNKQYLSQFNLLEMVEKRAEDMIKHNNDYSLKEILDNCPDKIKWLKENIVKVEVK